MNYYNLYNLAVANAGTFENPIQIVGTGYDQDAELAIVYYTTNGMETPEQFYMDQKTMPYFERYIQDGQIDSLCGRYFVLGLDFCKYDPAKSNQFFDWDYDEYMGVQIDWIAEMEEASDVPVDFTELFAFDDEHEFTEQLVKCIQSGMLKLDANELVVSDSLFDEDDDDEQSDVVSLVADGAEIPLGAFDSDEDEPDILWQMELS